MYYVEGVLLILCGTLANPGVRTDLNEQSFLLTKPTEFSNFDNDSGNVK
jgi:hypothetical protein